MQQKILFTAKKQPNCEILHSLAVNIFTSSMLVDYAAHNAETPTEWPKTVVNNLSEDEEELLHYIRSIMAHGWVLRYYVLKHLSKQHPVHTDWESLVTWLEELSDEDIKHLINEGILSGLEYYHIHLKPMPSVEPFLQKLGTSVPSHDMLSDSSMRVTALNALLHSWGVQNVDSTAKVIMDPSSFRDKMVSFIKALWERGFKDEWLLHEKLLKESAEEIKRQNNTSMSTEDLVIRVTGLKPEPKAFEVLDEAKTIIFVPCLHLGEFLSIFLVENDCFVLFDPLIQQTEDAKTQPDSLKDMGYLLEIIGDKTRLEILTLLNKQPGLHTVQISEALGVHQSTVSRHCQLLEKNRFIDIQKNNPYKCYRLNQDQAKELGQWLIDTLGP